MPIARPLSASLLVFVSSAACDPRGPDPDSSALQVLLFRSRPISEPQDISGSDYLLTVASNSNTGPADWWHAGGPYILVRGYYRVASGDPRSGVHLVLLRREVGEDGFVRYETVAAAMPDW